MERLGTILTTLLAAGTVLAVLAIVLAWPVQLLWNYCLVKAVDGINLITFWQALGINFLFGILFKNSNSK
jgi:hypothetical protein